VRGESIASEYTITEDTQTHKHELGNLAPNTVLSTDTPDTPFTIAFTRLLFPVADLLLVRLRPFADVAAAAAQVQHDRRGG
jgi:hypothetical protein